MHKPAAVAAANRTASVAVAEAETVPNQNHPIIHRGSMVALVAESVAIEIEENRGPLTAASSHLRVVEEAAAKV